MKRLSLLFALIVALAAPAFAHGGNDHVRGVVTAVSAQSITVQTAGKATKTLTLTDKTEFKRGKQKATVADVKVGDRVVIDVPEKSTQAVEVTIGGAAPTTARK
jgi:hypothetical protein